MPQEAINTITKLCRNYFGGLMHVSKTSLMFPGRMYVGQRIKVGWVLKISQHGTKLPLLN